MLFYKQFVDCPSSYVEEKEDNPLSELFARYKDCTLCGLYANIAQDKENSKVLGSGPLNPRLMVIGESPSNFDSITGKPFMDNQGKKVFGLVSYINRVVSLYNEVYYTNALLCPGAIKKNIDASTKECLDRLKEETIIVNPKIILILGYTTFTRISGEEYSGRKLYYLNTKDKYFPCVVTRRPIEFILNTELKQEVKKDLDFLVGVMLNDKKFGIAEGM
jgi:DNA polymerase